MRTALIAGCGYVGTALAKSLLADDGQDVIGLVRSESAVAALKRQHIVPLRIDLDDAPIVDALPTSAAILYYLVPPAANALSDSRLENLLIACEQDLPARIVYLSTSGVYGDCDGDWVDETAPLKPLTDRARRRLAAEMLLTDWAARCDVPFNILRVGGIYGPGKLPLARLRQGMTVICPAEAPYSNRIHVDDLVQVLRAVSVRGRPGAAYNVADGNPSTMTDYFYTLADLAGIPRPSCVPLKDAEDKLSPSLMSFLGESRRLRIDRLTTELRVELRFPTLRMGLSSCLSA